MRHAYVMSTARILSSITDLQHLHDSGTQNEKCRKISKHVCKTLLDVNQNVRLTSCI